MEPTEVKTCVSCHYCRNLYLAVTSEELKYHCAHTQAKHPIQSIVTGNYELNSCYAMRHNEHLCGKQAAFWTASHSVNFNPKLPAITNYKTRGKSQDDLLKDLGI